MEWKVPTIPPLGSNETLFKLFEVCQIATTNLASVIECEGFAISAQDRETSQTYRLGYRFQGDSEVNWVRNWHSRGENIGRAQKRKTPIRIPQQCRCPRPFRKRSRRKISRVTDHLVRRQLKNFYPHQFLQAIGDLIEDPDNRLREAEEHVAGRHAALGNEQMLEREIYPELYV